MADSLKMAVRLLEPENVSEFWPDKIALASTAFDKDHSNSNYQSALVALVLVVPRLGSPGPPD